MYVPPTCDLATHPNKRLAMRSHQIFSPLMWYWYGTSVPSSHQWLISCFMSHVASCCLLPSSHAQSFWTHNHAPLPIFIFLQALSKYIQVCLRYPLLLKDTLNFRSCIAIYWPVYDLSYVSYILSHDFSLTFLLQTEIACSLQTVLITSLKLP